MLLHINIFIILVHLINCEEKIICISKSSSTSSIKCTNTIEGIISGADLTSDISSNFADSDTDITLSLIGSDTEFNFALNIFNDKKLTINFDSSSNGTFDVTGLSNIDMSISYKGSTFVYPTVKLQGSTLNNDQTSIAIEKIKLETDFSEAQLKSFSTQQSSFSFSKLTVNILGIIANSNTELTFKDGCVVFDSQTITFNGETPSLSITLSSNFQLVVDNQATSGNYLPSISINTAKSVNFKGNDFSESNSISLNNCPVLAIDIGYLPISSSSFSTGSESDITLSISKSLTIKGSLYISSSHDLILGISGNTPDSRIPINIDSVSLQTGEIQFLSSWIDLTINDLKFKSEEAPLIPCVGFGGASTLTANKITLDGQASLSFNTISIKLEFTEEQTDESMANLINSQINLITFKSFTKASPVSNFETISFAPENINGFGNTDSSRIVNIKSTVTYDYVVTMTTTSLSTIPYLLCFAPRSGCTNGGKIFSDFSKLSEIVPADRKSIIVFIKKGSAAIDLSSLQTTGAEFTIKYDAITLPISSISTGDSYPFSKVDHLILDGISFNSGTFSFNTREATFKNCYISSTPSININEQTIVNIDQSSFNQVFSQISISLPQTNFITPIESCSSFEITDDQYLFTCESEISYSKEKLPKVSFPIQLSSNNDYTLTYKTSTPTIDSVQLNFVCDPNHFYNPKITVKFDKLDVVTSANKIGLNFGSFDSGNIVDFSVYNQADYFKIDGNNVQIIPDNNKPNGKICTCKETPCNGCEDGYSQVTYSQLQQTIQEYSGDAFRIIVFGDQDGSSAPSLSIGSLNGKDATIIGSGTNPKIMIDCSSEFNDESKTIEFSKIAVAHSAGTNLRVSNLKFLEGATIDQSFSSVSLNVNNLECDVSDLVFSTVSVQKSLVLTGDATIANTNAKVSFQSSSTFTYCLPQLVTFSGAKMIINNLEFDLSNAVTSFSIQQDLETFTIVGSNGNIDTVASDINLNQTTQLKSVYFNGTWANQNPSKFIVLKNFSSDLFLNSENIPVNVEYASFKNIGIENKKASIAGKISLCSESFGDYKFTTPVTESTATLTIKEINVTYVSAGTINFNFGSSNINLNIDTITLNSKFKIVSFNLLLDLDHQNQINIVNAFDESRNQALKINAQCTITESLNHPKMNEFVSNNHTLVTVNEQNTIKLICSLTFDDDAPAGFNSENFKLDNENHQIVFYTVNSPLEGEIDLYYGDCSSDCKGTQIKADSLSSIEDYIPMKSSLVIITFYDSLPENSVLNLDVPNLTIKYLTLRSASDIKKVPVRFGQSVANLEAEGISMENFEDDVFTMQKATLTKEAGFSTKAKFDNLKLLSADKESVFAIRFTEFKNELDLSLELEKPTDVSLTYTKAGMRILDSDSNEFNIDVSKMPKVSLYVKSTESPKINLDKDVTDLKQVKSFELDSKLIHIGTNWDKLETEKPIVLYNISEQDAAISVVTDSFPFEAWDLMYKYPIQFSDVLVPFTYSEEFKLDNKKLTISTYSPSKSEYYDVTFEELELSGDATIKAVSDQSDKSLIINDVNVEDNSASKISNAQIKEEIILHPGSSLSDSFDLAEGFSEIELEWDLNSLPLFSPSTLQTVVPAKINVEYKGRSIEGREQQFDDLLSNGVVILKNIGSCDNYIQNIHFKSEIVEEFKDGQSLSLKCQCVNENEIQLITTKKLVPTEAPPIKPTEKPENPTENPQNPTENPQKPTENPQKPTEKPENPTEQPIVPTNPPFVPTGGPTVDYTSYLLETEAVEFTKDGYTDGGKVHSSSGNQHEILLVNSASTSITASTTNDHPNSNMFISPMSKNAVITVSPPKGGQSDYGAGEIGVHANSNNPTISLPRSNVPLKIFNNENSEVSIKLNGQSDSSVSLNKMVVNNGNIKLNLPNGVSQINFENVEAYQTSSVDSLTGSNHVETRINNLDMKEKSTVTFANANFGQNIVSAQNSKLVVSQKSTFNENTQILLTESSFIEFGNSQIQGVCKEIKLAESPLSEETAEAEIQLVCGSNFNCTSWAEKFTGNQAFMSAKCIHFAANNEICLVASNRPAEIITKESHKKKLSGGAIAGIVIAVVVVVGLVIFLTLYCLKIRRGRRINEYTGVINQDRFIDDDAHL